MLPDAGVRAEGAEVGWPGRLHRWGATLLIASTVGLELWAVLGPHEDWPFTSAPMFARYQAPGDPVFELSFFVEDPAGVVELDPLRHLGMGELGFRREFFARYYGSTDPEHPSWYLPDDDETKFRKRVAEWMKLVVSAYARKQGHAPQRIWLEASKIDADGVECRMLFEFVASTGQLKTVPKVVPL